MLNIICEKTLLPRGRVGCSHCWVHKKRRCLVCDLQSHCGPKVPSVPLAWEPISPHPRGCIAVRLLLFLCLRPAAPSPTHTRIPPLCSVTSSGAAGEARLRDQERHTCRCCVSACPSCSAASAPNLTHCRPHPAHPEDQHALQQHRQPVTVSYEVGIWLLAAVPLAPSPISSPQPQSFPL